MQPKNMLSKFVPILMANEWLKSVKVSEFIELFLQCGR